MCPGKEIILVKLFIRLTVALIILSFLLSWGCRLNPFTAKNVEDFSDSSGKIIEEPGKTEEEIREHEGTNNGVFSGNVYFERAGNIRVPGQAIDVNISGNYAYLTNDLGILYVIDIYDKKNPVIVGECTDLDSSDIVIVRDEYAYISYTQQIIDDGDYYTKCGFRIVYIGDKGEPGVVGEYNTSNGEKKFVSGFYIDGDFAYLNTHTYGEDFEDSSMEIVDISVKRRPWLTGSVTFDGIPSGIFVKEGNAFINLNYYDSDKEDYTGQSMLLVVDVNDSINPEIRKRIETPPQSWAIYAEGDYIYITSHQLSEEDGYVESFLSIYDISNTGNISLHRNVELPGGAWEIDFIDDYVFVSTLGGGLYAVDVSKKESPFIYDRYSTGGKSYDISLLGNYGYLVDGFDGLEIISLSDEDTNLKPSMIIDEETGNYIPVASMEISGDRINMYYQAGNPVYFSSAGSFDPEGKKLTYRWLMEGELFSVEESACYLFEKSGINDIELVVSDGETESSAKATVSIAESNYPVSKIVEHDFILEIEYILENRGPVDLTDIECHMRVPQSYHPYQAVNDIDTNISGIQEVFDNNWNKLINFVFEETLSPGEKISAVSVIDITVSEFDYLPLKTSINYDKEAEDYIRYTSGDLFIDSGNTLISQAAGSVAGNGENPLVIAENLYNFVIKKLSYDYERAQDDSYPFYYASEILERGSGVCADYAILYTALLRSAGIPSRLAAGVPTYTTLYEKNQEIEQGHAWVEIKFPGYGWVPVDITAEEKFWSGNYFMNIITEKGPGYLYENRTMDWTSYYYDGFKFEWEGDDFPDIEQSFKFRINGLEVIDVMKD
ncbi:MAG: hypothetical protein JW770_07140 [Actinobacteria bacterium]|nr:hypothetical protein [Actinomycetota bacterium]